MAPLVRAELEQRFGIQIRDDVRGLNVYEEGDRPVKYFPMEVRVGVTASVDQFVHALEAHFARHEGAGLSSHDEAAALAMDLYFLADFETSERARFLTLITALEVLSVRGKQRPSVLRFVDQSIAKARALVSAAADDADRKGFESLLGSLNQLKVQSIGSAVRALVQERLPETELYSGTTPWSS